MSSEDEDVPSLRTEEEDAAPPQLRTTRVRPQLTPRPSTPPPPKRSSALPPVTGLGKGDGGPSVDPEALATWCRRNEVDDSEGGVRCFNCRGNEILDPVRQALERRGWVENTDPNSLVFHLKWTVKAEYVEELIEAGKIRPGQILNHFRRNYELMTKHGLSRNLRSLPSFEDCDADELVPRAYYMKDVQQVREFLADYCLCAAQAVLRAFLAPPPPEPPSTEPPITPARLAVAHAIVSRFLERLSRQQQQQYSRSPPTPGRATPSPAKPLPVASTAAKEEVEVEAEAEVKAQSAVAAATVCEQGWVRSAAWVARTQALAQAVPLPQGEAEWLALFPSLTPATILPAFLIAEDRVTSRWKPPPAAAASSTFASSPASAAAAARWSAATAAVTAAAAAAAVAETATAAAAELPPTPSRAEVVTTVEALEQLRPQAKQIDGAANVWILKSAAALFNPLPVPLLSDSQPQPPPQPQPQPAPRLRLRLRLILTRALLTLTLTLAPNSCPKPDPDPPHRSVGLSRGRGISVACGLAQILDKCHAKKWRLMVQKYVERPLTIKARKFDIRLWVLVTSINPLAVPHVGKGPPQSAPALPAAGLRTAPKGHTRPRLALSTPWGVAELFGPPSTRMLMLFATLDKQVVWHYSDFYLRFSSRPYSADDLAPGKEVDLAVHLTNQCIQKQCDEYGADEEIECNMWSSAQMEQHLHAELGAAEGAVVYERVVTQMLAAVSASMRSVCDVVEGRAGSHELYGFDFMLDETYGVRCTVSLRDALHDALRNVPSLHGVIFNRVLRHTHARTLTLARRVAARGQLLARHVAQRAGASQDRRRGN